MFSKSFTASRLIAFAVSGIAAGALLAGFQLWTKDASFGASIRFGILASGLVFVAQLLGDLIRVWLDERWGGPKR